MQDKNLTKYPVTEYNYGEYQKCRVEIIKIKVEADSLIYQGKDNSTRNIPAIKDIRTKPNDSPINWMIRFCLLAP